jgi:hypothetical protein
MEHMTPRAVTERVERIISVRADAGAGRDAITAGLVATREIAAWLAAQEAGLVAQLSKVESFPEATIAEASRGSLSAANTTRGRSETLSDTPSLAAAMEDGQVTAGHVDAVTRAAKQVDPDQRDDVLACADSLADIAAVASVRDFADRLAREVEKIRTASAETRLERQRRATRLSIWTGGDGMVNLRGQFDPESGLAIATKISNAVETLFAQSTPELCPSDPVEKQKFLNAHALLALSGGGRADEPGPTSQTSERDAGGRVPRGGAVGSARPGKAEFVAVIDADVPAPDGGGPLVQWPLPIELPARVLAELAGTADVVGVVVRNGVVLYAPGELNLGRSTRLANRPQRRALRGLYRGCAIPGCTVQYDRCKLHHVVWWRHGGRTDLDNLLPVCSKHHGKIHHDNWVIELGPNRELTLRLPDGQVMTTGPPSRRAAA